MAGAIEKSHGLIVGVTEKNAQLDGGRYRKIARLDSGRNFLANRPKEDFRAELSRKGERVFCRFIL